MVNTHDENGNQDNLLTTLYQQEMFKNGILVFLVFLCFSIYKKSDLDILVEAFNKTLKNFK